MSHPYGVITEENIERYAQWCDGIVVNNSIVFKDRQGVLRTAEKGSFIIKTEKGLVRAKI
jgi:hypothetical protein